MAGSPSPLTTHVLNTGMGIPASNMALSLYRKDPSTNAWSLLKTGYGTVIIRMQLWKKLSYVQCVYWLLNNFLVSTGLLMKMDAVRGSSHHKCLQREYIKSILTLLSTGRVLDRQAFTHM